jgi:DNA (cytosine-5)-methyltransferase 1
LTGRPRAIGLFSGIGGLDLGLQQAGYKIAASLDVDRECCSSLRANHKNRPVICRSICDITGRGLLRISDCRRGSVALLAGGPPCQPFSRSNEGRRKGMRDPRGKLILEMTRFAEEIEPDSVLIENVPGLASVSEGSVVRRLARDLSDIGYSVGYRILDAADFGVPQHRKRLFIIGTKHENQFSFPVPTHGRNRTPFVTAKMAIGDLDDGVTHCGSESIGGKYGRLIDKIPEGMNYQFYTKEAGHPRPKFVYRSKYWHFLRKLARNQPSSTIQASPGPFVGPIHWRNRHLTLLEAKRLQTLPDALRTSEDPNIAWGQVGNAVPPLLASRIGASLLQSSR